MVDFEQVNVSWVGGSLSITEHVHRNLHMVHPFSTCTNCSENVTFGTP